MTLTTRQWVQVGATVAVAGAAILGGVLSSSPRAPKPAPAASQPAAPAIQTPLAPTPQPSLTVSVDTVVQWVGCITADSTTGALRSDIGWWPCGQAAGKHLAYCRVGTMTKPVFRRVLLAPRGEILWLVSNPANFQIVDCTQAFQQWDSLETVSQGRWPKP